MTKITFISETVEQNGKTIKENNLEKKHTIPLGTLVEVKYDDSDYRLEDQHSGVRLFITQHTRDCDGTPLYGLSFNRIAGEQLDQAEKDLEKTKNDSMEYTLVHWTVTKLRGSILSGFSEEVLKIV